MRKFLNDIQSFQNLGFKQLNKAVAVSATLGFMGINSVSAATPNVPPPSIKANAPHVYVVKKGDTLWEISGKFLDKPWRWREIWASNRHIKNPHWIYPNDRLLLCTLNGRPLVGRDEGDGCTGIVRRYSGQVTLQPQVRIEQFEQSIPVIPLNQIQPWLDRSTIIASENIKNLPYIIGASDNRVIAGAGQKVYARGQGFISGQRYAVYHVGEPYFETTTKGKKHVIGIELRQVASGIATQTENDITTIELVQSYGSEVSQSDLVMPEQDAMLPTLFYPTENNEIKAGGQIVRILGSIGSATKNSSVTINRGRLDGANAGDILEAYQQGEWIQDPKTNKQVKLPNQKIGTVMIFKTFDHLSYAYVLDSSLPIHVGAAVLPTHLDN